MNDSDLIYGHTPSNTIYVAHSCGFSLSRCHTARGRQLSHRPRAQIPTRPTSEVSNLLLPTGIKELAAPCCSLDASSAAASSATRTTPWLQQRSSLASALARRRAASWMCWRPRASALVRNHYLSMAPAARGMARRTGRGARYPAPPGPRAHLPATSVVCDGSALAQ
jgi:hypothetical protein